MWISPLNCENFDSWEILKVNELFVLQKSVAQVGLFWKTLQNVFDTKQPPFRIVFKSSQNQLGQVIAVGNTKEEIDKDWKYIMGKKKKKLIFFIFYFFFFFFFYIFI